MGRGDGVSISLTLDWPVKHIAPRSSCKKIFRALLNCEARFFYFSFAGRFYGPGKGGRRSRPAPAHTHLAQWRIWL
jgi:hypothetical protein